MKLVRGMPKGAHRSLPLVLITEGRDNTQLPGATISNLIFQGYIRKGYKESEENKKKDDSIYE